MRKKKETSKEDEDDTIFMRTKSRRMEGKMGTTLRTKANVVCVYVVAFVTFRPSMLQRKTKSVPFFLQGLQIACQLDHNRDQGSRDNLTLWSI